ncbi:MAG: lipopolysaccharide/colanic/teichoic acid biosynthesis glycosyltransferase [Planctomycetota bacterium]|jgi:lipopolysaccharide/colanic/teichoic acid biosynthesis glycosyltransferase
MSALVKRSFDVLVALTALVFLMPVMALVTLFVLIFDHPPVFFLQERICRAGKPFVLVKFRTMRAEDGPEITSQDDKRKTPLGSFLRRYRLDELPQLVHVLRGEMSLVGPRPEVPKFIDHTNPDQAVVLSVRPGLVDPAVLAYFNEEEKLRGVDDPEQYYCEKLRPRKLALSASYVETAGFWSDLRLLFAATWRIFGLGNQS